MTSQEFLDRLLHGCADPRSSVVNASGRRRGRRTSSTNEAVERFMNAVRGKPKLSKEDQAKFLRQLQGKDPIRKRSTRARSLRESCECSDAKPGGQGLLRNVLVLGENSLNGRRYERAAMQAALPLYEGAKVNCDHPANNPAESRSVRDRIGKLENVRLAPDGIRADLRFNPHTSMGKQLQWWSKFMPTAVGLSHNSIGRGRDEDGLFVVEEIVAVRSVDLVADSASTPGLH